MSRVVFRISCVLKNNNVNCGVPVNFALQARDIEHGARIINVIQEIQEFKTNTITRNFLN